MNNNEPTTNENNNEYEGEPENTRWVVWGEVKYLYRNEEVLAHRRDQACNIAMDHIFHELGDLAEYEVEVLLNAEEQKCLNVEEQK